MKEETSYAKQLFMFGEGKTKPIKNIDALSKASGAPVQTLRPWMPKWRKECTELALLHENSPYTLSLSEDVLAQHREEINFLGAQVEKLRKRVKKTATISPNYPVYLSCYQSALTKWEKSSGILAHLDTASAAMRETAKAAAKAKANQGNDTDTVKRVIDRSRFDVEG